MPKANLAHIMRGIHEARERGVTRVEVRQIVPDEYMRHVWQRADGTVVEHRTCATANSYDLNRHGDASLPLPHTPWWRVIRGRSHGQHGYRLGALRSRPDTTRRAV